MKKLLTLSLMVGALLLFFIGPVQAAPFTFGDSVNYWGQNAAWSSQAWQSPQGWDNTHDTIGNPHITGGQGDVDGQGALTNLSISYTSFNSQITAGALFIDSNANTYWDYVLTPDEKIYQLSPKRLSALQGVNDSLYDMSDKYFRHGYRNKHPVGIKVKEFNKVGIQQIGTYTLTNFNSNLTTDVSFTSFLSLDPDPVSIGLNLGNEFIIGFGPTCANDVIYETVTNPVPIPTTLLLFGTGLIGLAGIKRRRR